MTSPMKKPWPELATPPELRLTWELDVAAVLRWTMQVRKKTDSPILFDFLTGLIRFGPLIVWVSCDLGLTSIRFGIDLEIKVIWILMCY